MSLRDVKDIIAGFDPLVEDKFKDSLALNLKSLQNNPTRLKLKHLLLNLPMGAFFKADDLDIKESGPINYQYLVSILKDKNYEILTKE